MAGEFIYDELKKTDEILAELIVEDNSEMFDKIIEILKKPAQSKRYINAMKCYIEQHYPITTNQQVLEEILQKQ